jgi:hypothetical protein
MAATPGGPLGQRLRGPGWKRYLVQANGVPALDGYGEQEVPVVSTVEVLRRVSDRAEQRGQPGSAYPEEAGPLAR